MLRRRADDGDVLDESPGWPSAVGVVLSLAGLAVSAYLTYAHYTTAASLACPESSVINCVKVTTSSYSYFLGFPVAVLGLVFFGAMLPLQLPAAWRSSWAPLRLGRLGATVIGVGMVLWLLYAELFRLDAICLYCTAAHVLTLGLFCSTALGTVATAAYDDGGPDDGGPDLSGPGSGVAPDRREGGGQAPLAGRIGAGGGSREVDAGG